MKESKILIVEDNFITSDEINDMMLSIGFTNIETAYNGLQAIKKAKTMQPDLILMDINLGEGINGIQAATEIKKEINVPIIYITAYDDDKTLKQTRVTEPYAYVLKPIELRDLQIAVDIAIYKHKTEKELIDANKKLKELNNTKNKFFSIISHDLKGPMSAILGMLELLQKNHTKQTDERREKYIEGTLSASKKLYKLLDNLLVWSRTQSESITFTPRKINLYETIKDVIIDIKAVADKKNIRIKNNFEKNCFAYADDNMLNTVLRNLMSNAIKFTCADGEININNSSDSNTSDYLQISVCDNGIGIPEKLIGDIFNIEKNTSREGTENESGTGLGLILCHEFITKHGGSLHVKSEVNVGSEFYFTLKRFKDEKHEE